MFRQLPAAALLIVSLAACQAQENGGPAPSGTSEPAASPSPEPEADECGAGKLDRWLNVLPTETVKQAIAEAVGQRPTRYYKQGDPITMDFNPARLNVETGEDGRIKVFRCG